MKIYYYYLDFIRYKCNTLFLMGLPLLKSRVWAKFSYYERSSRKKKKKWNYFEMVFNLFLAFLKYFVLEVLKTTPKGAPIIAIIKGKVMSASFS